MKDAAAIDDDDPRWQFSVALEKAMLFEPLGIMRKTVPDDQSAMIDPKAHPVTGQDKRLMGLPARWTAPAFLRDGPVSHTGSVRPNQDHLRAGPFIGRSIVTTPS